MCVCVRMYHGMCVYWYERGRQTDRQTDNDRDRKERRQVSRGRGLGTYAVSLCSR